MQNMTPVRLRSHCYFYTMDSESTLYNVHHQPYDIITVTSSSKHFLFFSWETCEEKSKILTFALRHTSTLVGNNTRNVYTYCIAYFVGQKYTKTIP
jgi:hypothetical protein